MFEIKWTNIVIVVTMTINYMLKQAKRYYKLVLAVLNINNIIL